MYKLGVKRSFIARHYLTGGDFGEENNRHSHHYELEVKVSGEDLDAYGYLVDITDLETALGSVVTRYADSTLNELPEFEGVNPSLENFARLIFDRVIIRLKAENVTRMTVKLWEDPKSWAEYSREL
ncbi:MAG: 6-pyruvoyl trahydropterin synthase family protein [Desulfurivibrionaceae bacterium]